MEREGGDGWTLRVDSWRADQEPGSKLKQPRFCRFSGF